MQHDWILDVLADLKTFATANGLPALAEQLEDTRLVAMAEVASALEGAEIGLRGTDATIGTNTYAAGSIRRA